VNIVIIVTETIIACYLLYKQLTYW